MTKSVRAVAMTMGFSSHAAYTVAVHTAAVLGGWFLLGAPLYSQGVDSSGARPVVVTTTGLMPGEIDAKTRDILLSGIVLGIDRGKRALEFIAEARAAEAMVLAHAPDFHAQIERITARRNAKLRELLNEKERVAFDRNARLVIFYVWRR